MRNFKPWTKLIEDYATEFFSGAIQCNMGENIKSLEVREKLSPQDVFKARTEKVDTKKKADEKQKKTDENNKY